MRQTAALLFAFCSIPAFAASFNQKDTLSNTRYRESPEENTAREFKEHEADLPPLPATDAGEWFDLYVGEQYGKQPKILLDSLQIMPAPDTSIRYILNTRSDRGYDNLTAEGIFCARSSFIYGKDKLSSYKTFGYGDTVNKRWIQPRKAEWKPIGSTMSRNEAIRAVLYNAFCVDGTPKDVQGLVQRLKERAGRYSPKIINHDK